SGVAEERLAEGRVFPSASNHQVLDSFFRHRWPPYRLLEAVHSCNHSTSTRRAHTCSPNVFFTRYSLSSPRRNRKNSQFLQCCVKSVFCREACITTRQNILLVAGLACRGHGSCHSTKRRSSSRKRARACWALYRRLSLT